MTSVITGDIVKSKSMEPSIWLPRLKTALAFLQKDAKLWEVYRGDSFQIEIQDIYQSFISAVYLKACLKMIKGIDVRLSIGLGNKTFHGEKISESNGLAFENSGITLESLKRERINLKILARNKLFDEEMNLYFRLALIAMDNWTINSAEAVKTFLENENQTQKILAEKIGINQDAFSKRLKRAHIDEILELNQRYQNKLANIQSA